MTDFTWPVRIIDGIRYNTVVNFDPISSRHRYEFEKLVENNPEIVVISREAFDLDGNALDGLSSLLVQEGYVMIESPSYMVEKA